MAEAEIDRKIAVIFVADVVGYSKHMEKDENATFKAYGECEKILNKLLKKYKGSVFNTAGDSVLAEFPSAVNAVECAVDFQNEITSSIFCSVIVPLLIFNLGSFFPTICSSIFFLVVCFNLLLLINFPFLKIDT